MRPDPENISGKDYWDKVADNISGYYLIPKLADYKSREYISLIERWGLINRKSVLVTDLYEAANGNVGIYSHLDNVSQRLTVIDISPKLCLNAKENLKPLNIKTDVISADVRQIPLADRSADLIISPSTFDHFPEIGQALSECYRILKPDGRLVLALNSADNPLFKLGVRLAERFKKHEYQTDYFYSVRRATTLLKQAGFAVGRSTAIMHIPIGLTTLIENFDRCNNPVTGRINGMMISACRQWGRLGGKMKLFTGWWIVLEGIKR